MLIKAQALHRRAGNTDIYNTWPFTVAAIKNHHRIDFKLELAPESPPMNWQNVHMLTTSVYRFVWAWKHQDWVPSFDFTFDRARGFRGVGSWRSSEIDTSDGVSNVTENDTFILDLNADHNNGSNGIMDVTGTF